MRCDLKDLLMKVNPVAAAKEQEYEKTEEKILNDEGKKDGKVDQMAETNTKKKNKKKGGKQAGEEDLLKMTNNKKEEEKKTSEIKVEKDKTKDAK